MENLILVMLVVILLQTSFVIYKLPRSKNGKNDRMILLDTSVLIDGRIIAVAESGFVGDRLVVPRSVVGELQLLADVGDADKRARARYGLDVIKLLQDIPEVRVEILQDGSKAAEGVDERLLALAKDSGAAICTIDFNLNKVAKVEKIEVLNVNELAQSLRMAYLPGEKMMLELTSEGQDGHQAIGHLKDGTMVVVENASKFIGKKIEIEFIRSLQTAAGKMMFAKLSDPSVSATKTKSSANKKSLANKITSKVKLTGGGKNNDKSKKQNSRSKNSQPSKPVRGDGVKSRQRKSLNQKEDDLMQLVARNAKD